MGCGSSATADVLDGDQGRSKKGPGVRPPPTGADDDDIPTELLPESQTAPIKPPLAFEVSLDEDQEQEAGTQGLVKRHPPRPPKRLSRLNSIEPTTPSLSELQEKLESAEKRRQTILQSRIASANKASRQLIRIGTERKDGDTPEMDDILDSPTKDMTKLKNLKNSEEHGVQT